MISYRDVEERAMPKEKKDQCRDDWFSYYVGRKLTYFMTIPLLYTNITPNQVTCVSIFMLLIGFVFNCFGKNTTCVVIAWICYFLWSLLDGVDGNIARYKKNYSKKGDLLDTIGGYLAYALFFLGMGISSFFMGSINWNIGIYYIIIGALSSISCIFPRLIYQKILAGGESYIELQKVKSDSKSFVRLLAINVTSISGGVMVVSLFSIIFNLLDVFTIVYCILNMCKMLVSIISMLKITEGNAEKKLYNTVN